jgi:hypothetical protein
MPEKHFFRGCSVYVDVIRSNGELAPFHDGVLRELLAVVRPSMTVQNKAAVSNYHPKVTDVLAQAALEICFQLRQFVPTIVFDHLAFHRGSLE